MLPWGKFVCLSAICNGHTDDIKTYHCRCSIKVLTMCVLIHPTRYRSYEERKLTNSQWYGPHRLFKMNVFSSPSAFAMFSCLQKSMVEEVHNLHASPYAFHLTASTLSLCVKFVSSILLFRLHFSLRPKAACMDVELF